jgi:hypothetical protein
MEALDAFVERVLQSLMVGVRGHRLPSYDEKLEAWYDPPDCRSTLTRERLLDLRRLLGGNVSKGY